MGDWPRTCTKIVIYLTVCAVLVWRTIADHNKRHREAQHANQQ